MSSLTFDFCDTTRVIQEIPPDERPVMSMNGWPYNPRPKTPYQRTFKAKLFGLRWFMSTNGPNLFPGLIPTQTNETAPTSYTPTVTTSGFPSAASVTLTATDTAVSGQTYTIGAVEAGKTYKVTVDVTTVGGGVRMRIGYGATPSKYLNQVLSNGIQQYTFVADGFRNNVQVFIENTTGTGGWVLNTVSINAQNSLGLDTTTSPTINAGRLLDFYRQHRTWDSFYLNHEYLGVIRVRFSKPVVIPEGKEDSVGLIEPFDIELIEHNPSY